MIIITVNDINLKNALDRLFRVYQNPKGALFAIAEDIKERTKQRFSTTTDAEGKKWAPNSPATLAIFARNRGRKSKSFSKKPLTGLSKDLRRRIFHQFAGKNAVIIGSPTKYAAAQQFGASKGQFGKTIRNAPIPFGNIPARQFLPITADKKIAPSEAKIIQNQISQLIADAATNK